MGVAKSFLFGAPVLAAVVAFVACSDFEASVPPGGEARSGVKARVRCNGAFCEGDVCCTTLVDGDITSAVCKPQADCATTFLTCDDSEDCAKGEVCCAETNGGDVDWRASACKSSCTGSQRQLCAQPWECDAGACAPAASNVRPTGLRACAQ